MKSVKVSRETEYFVTLESALKYSCSRFIFGQAILVEPPILIVRSSLELIVYDPLNLLQAPVPANLLSSKKSKVNASASVANASFVTLSIEAPKKRSMLTTLSDLIGVKKTLKIAFVYAKAPDRSG